MNHIIYINLGGVERCLRFNNFAIIEISKMVFESGYLSANPNDFLDKLQEIADMNTFLLMKILIYGGIVGNDYIVGFKPSITSDEVGELVANVDEKELVGIWDTFVKSMGIDIFQDPSLSSLPENEESVLKAEKKN
jgi:hypothetical protein